MTTTRSPKPWHAVVRLKDELRSGELALAEFAADLHEVTLVGGGRSVKSRRSSSPWASPRTTCGRRSTSCSPRCRRT